MKGNAINNVTLKEIMKDTTISIKRMVFNSYYAPYVVKAASDAYKQPGNQAGSIELIFLDKSEYDKLIASSKARFLLKGRILLADGNTDTACEIQLGNVELDMSRAVVSLSSPSVMLRNVSMKMYPSDDYRLIDLP